MEIFKYLNISESEIAGLAPLELGGDPERALVAAHAVALVLASYHESGSAHGDVRPASIFTGARTVLLPSPGNPPAAIVRARIAEGAPLSEVAFVAPELLDGGPATPAGDVYALAWTVRALLPRKTLERALAPEPALRPTAAELARALAPRSVTAPLSRKLQPATNPEEPERAERDVPVILALLLILGGLFTVVGALWLVAAGWDVLGEVGRFAVLGALTAGSGIAGLALERRGRARSGFALVSLATLLLWADAALLLVRTRATGLAAIGTAAASAIALASFLPAWRRRSPLLAALVALGAAMACSLTWQALDGSGRAAVLALVAAALALLGARLETTGRAGAAELVLLLANALVPLDGAYVLSQIGLAGSASGQGTVALVTALASGALAVGRRSRLFASLAALSLGAGVLGLGEAASLGPASIALVASSALALLALAFGRIEAALAWPPAVLASLAVALSTSAAVVDAVDHPAIALVWPYLTGAGVLAVAISRRSTRVAKALIALAASVSALGVAGVALVASDLPRAWIALAPFAGAALAALAFLSRKLDRTRQVALCAVALSHVVAAKSVSLEALGFAIVLFAFAARDTSRRLYALAGLAASVAVVFEVARALGRTGDMPALALLASSIIVVALAKIARRISREASDGAGALAGVLLGASGVLALAPASWFGANALLPEAFPLIWPYLIAALAAIHGSRETGASRSAAFHAMTAVLVAAPIWQATLFKGELATLWIGGAPAAAGMLAALAFSWPRIAHVEFRLGSCIAIALAHVLVAKSPGMEVGAIGAAIAGLSARTRSGRGLAVAALAWAIALGLESRRVFGEASDAVALVALGCAVVQICIASVARRRFGEGSAEAAGIFAALSLLVSAGGALARAPEGATRVLPAGWTVAWPYLVALVAGAFGVTRTPGTIARGLSVGLALVVLVLAPTGRALEGEGRPARLLAASIAGAVLVGLALRWPRVARSPRLQAAFAAAGALDLALAPGVLACRALASEGDATRLLEAPALLLVYAVGTSLGLTAIGVGMTLIRAPRIPARVLELAGLLLFFVVLSVVSIERPADYLAPAVLFPGAFVALCAGAFTRDLLLVALPAGFLVPNLCLQYFAKLSGKFPFALLFVGFGLGVLVFGVLFEVSIRRRLLRTPSP